MEILYEISYLLKSGLNDNEAGNFGHSLEAKIGEEGGLIKESMRPMRNELGYQIQEQTHAWVGKIIFGIEQNPEKIQAIKTFAAASGHILRIAYFRTSKNALIETRQRLESAMARSRASAERHSLETSAKQMLSPTAQPENQEFKGEKPKVEMAEIEKRLEELLK